MPRKLSTETISRMADEVVDMPAQDRNTQAVVDLVGALLEEMTAMRNMGVGSSEPATTYDASEA